MPPLLCSQSLLWTYIAISSIISSSTASSLIDRQSIVQKHNPTRNNASQLAYDTPMMLGNGHIGFGADITGLQSLLPFNILSSWGWHNDSLPLTANQTSSSDFVGLEWEVHGREVEYAQPNPDLPEISQWMIANPHRVNLGRVGLGLHGEWLTEDVLSDAEQTLDLWTGLLTSRFSVNGERVVVKTAVDPYSDTIGIEIDSELLQDGTLAVLVDYPYASGANKFDAPFVGVWNTTDNHTTEAKVTEPGATIHHQLDATSYENVIRWEESVTFSGPAAGTHRYSLTAKGGSTLTMQSTFSSSPKAVSPSSAVDIFAASAAWWETYWSTGGFIVFPKEAGADELQRRTILSQYLLAVNSADSEFLTQESGLVNNGWYGKFHMEMFVWHNMHFLLWGKPQYLSQMLPGMYERFLSTSIARAREMGYDGARWGKMSDPSGRSAPGEINSLLIWQQPHPMFFADQEYRLAMSQQARDEILRKWAPILEPTADFMASFAWWNASTERYDLGPPMYTSSENTIPQETVNPAFELAYWQFGLQVAADWKTRMGQPVPEKWLDVQEKLSPLPKDTINGTATYVIYEGIPDMWNNETYTFDHPSMSALLGFMPWIAPSTHFDTETFDNTYNAILNTWNLTQSYGWDFPMLAMAASRLGRKQEAIDLLLHPSYGFDDVGMPVGGERVPTPYLPQSGGLLMAAAVMAGVWGVDSVDQGEGSWPAGWDVQVEGFPNLRYTPELAAA